MAPPQFLQIYVIHVSLGEVTIPLVYAFLENETEGTYHELFTAILNRCATYGVRPDPDVVTVDFELAVPRALTAVFGQQVQVQFCFFHLTQSTWRKIQEMGIAATYRTDNNFRHFCGMLDGLAFLPPTDVSAGITYLRTIATALAVPLLRLLRQNVRLRPLQTRSAAGERYQDGANRSPVSCADVECAHCDSK